MQKGRLILISQNEVITGKNYIWNCKNDILYGPVISRRLGRSLGINLFPSDINFCNFDCIYCDCGPSIKTINNPHDFVTLEKIKGELKSSFEYHLINQTPIDYITFAGNGEPTLYPFFPQVVDYILELRDKYSFHKPLAIFSNGTMISNQDVVKSILKLDEKIFKLDASDKETFELINQPKNKLTLKKIINWLSGVKNIKISSAVICSNIRNFDSLKNHNYIQTLNIIKPTEVHLYSIDYPSESKNVRRARISKMLELAEYIVNNLEITVKVLQARKIKYYSE